VCLRILCGKTERDAFFFFLFFSSPGWVQLTLPPNWTFFFPIDGFTKREETSLQISSARAHTRKPLSQRRRRQTSEKLRGTTFHPNAAAREKDI
jgi:hypothetical protein